jgi:hypothetical protein
VKNALFLEVLSVKVLIQRIAWRPKERRELAGATRLESAAFCVTDRRSIPRLLLSTFSARFLQPLLRINKR